MIVIWDVVTIEKYAKLEKEVMLSVQNVRLQ